MNVYALLCFVVASVLIMFLAFSGSLSSKEYLRKSFSSLAEALLKQNEYLAEALSQQKDYFTGVLVAQKDSLAEMLSRQKDYLAEILSDQKDSFAEAMSEQKDSFQQNFFSLVSAMSEQRNGIQSLTDAISAQNDCFRQLMGVTAGMNDKLDGMFSVMKTPNGKGRMGEWQLESLLKSVRTNSGLSYLVKPDLKGGKPDFAIPVGDRYLYIDSKLPYDSYKAYLENPTEQNFKSFLSDVKRCADNIKEKYVSAEDSIGTAVLYLPSESMMRDILEHYPKLATDLESEGVVLLSSLYLPFFLRLFTDCCSLVEWEKNFAKRRFEIFSLISKAGKELYNLGKDIEKAESSFFECKRTMSDLSNLLNPKE